MNIKVKDINRQEEDVEIINQLVGLESKRLRDIIRITYRVRRGNRIIAGAERNIAKCSTI